MKFSFSPNALAATQTWEIRGKTLTTPEQQALDISQLSGGRFNDGSFRGRFFTFFDLTIGETIITITCEDHAQGQNRKACFDLIGGVIEQLKFYNPSLQIQIGPDEKTKQLEKSTIYLFILLVSAFSIPLIANSLESFDYISAVLIILFVAIISIFLAQVTKSNQATQPLSLTEFEDWLKP